MNSLIKIFLPVIIILSVGSTAFCTEDQNYCHDPSTWVEWNELLQKNPTDDGIYSAYALRVGLCEMIEEDMIEFDRAVRIFEHFRNSLVETKKRLEELQKQKEDNPL